MRNTGALMSDLAQKLDGELRSSRDDGSTDATAAHFRHPGQMTLATKLWRGWAAASLIWVIAVLGVLFLRWDDIYPTHPNYLIVPDDARDKLVVWYSNDESVPIGQYKRDRGLGQAEEVTIGRNVLLLPSDLTPAQKQDFTRRARDMEQVLLHRFHRGVAMRFLPIVLIIALGPPLLLIFVGKCVRRLLTRWMDEG